MHMLIIVAAMVIAIAAPIMAAPRAPNMDWADEADDGSPDVMAEQTENDLSDLS
ncbi:MAG: hypothetical protein WDM79_12550 [Terricaulis sp.]